MPKGNWMYGDNLGKEKEMLDVIGSGIRDKSILEFTKEDIDDLDLDSPIGEKPWPLRMAIKSTLYWIGVTYMWLCTLFTTGVIIYALKG